MLVVIDGRNEIIKLLDFSGSYKTYRVPSLHFLACTLFDIVRFIFLGSYGDTKTDL